MTEEAPVRTLAVVCADWPVVALGRPPGLPVAVLSGHRVLSVSRAARAEGVLPGLRRREAQARCPSVELHDRDDSRDARAFEGVLAALEDLAPRLEVLDAGRCLIPTRGPSRFHGGDRALAGRVLHAVRAAVAPASGPGPVRSLVSSDVVSSPLVGVGVADGPRAAILVAVEALRRADAAGGVLVVAPGATASFLAPLPVARMEALGREPLGMVEVLRRMGLRTIGRFAALEEADVLARFGASGADLHRLVNGRERVPPDVSASAPDLRVVVTLDPPADRVDRAAFAARSLAEELHRELADRGLACTRVLVVAETEVGERIERLWRSDGAMSAVAIGQRVRWQLEGWLGSGRSRSRCTGGVSRLELVPDEVRNDTGDQLGFWGGVSESGERALRALARVQALVGPEGVLVPEWQGGRSPAEQYRLVPLDAVDPSSRRRRDRQPWPGALPSPSPAVVWSRPRLVDVLDHVGRRVGVSGRGSISAPPTHVVFGRDDGGRVVVRSWSGPWCVDERWWDAVGHRRRARLQVVVDPGGSAHLLALEDGRWWLEATYD